MSKKDGKGEERIKSRGGRREIDEERRGDVVLGDAGSGNSGRRPGSLLVLLIYVNALKSELPKEPGTMV